MISPINNLQGPTTVSESNSQQGFKNLPCSGFVSCFYLFNTKSKTERRHIEYWILNTKKDCSIVTGYFVCDCWKTFRVYHKSVVEICILVIYSLSTYELCITFEHWKDIERIEIHRIFKYFIRKIYVYHSCSSCCDESVFLRKTTNVVICKKDKGVSFLRNCSAASVGT